MSAFATNTIRRKRHASPKQSRRARDGEDDEPDHPLHYVSDAPTFASAIRDGTITRPNLRRQLHTGSTSDVLSVNPTYPGPTRKRSHSETTSPIAFFSDDWTSTPGSSGSQSGPEIQPSTNTREVLVSPTDSLAGVALKYGIKVAALRKANKLWTSDTIHLRKVLYIPVEWQPSLKKSFTPSDGDMPSNHTSDNTTKWAAPTGSTSKPSSSTPSTVSVVRRIPVSELSFFPPGTSLPEAVSPPPPSAFPSFDSHASRPRGTQNVSMLNLFGNTIARMSTDSISSLTRTSMSDDPGMGSRAAKMEVELDVAQNTWRTTPIPTHAPPPPTERLHAKGRKAPGKGMILPVPLWG
ncbi:carbohydrate-binding module family 50 protein [Hydnum rufescens UP504]|uniref:Carbohydrate-binding module family 50 protein n=1 Tax=Hydnum rufescens UP504 TaxID=1448309 RepID=A0A9P6DZ72_9AGAM|nr:carbohydrate-binding module family 50 protein [Hydnum rufescens UP504]